jgi:hypothetical protein
MIEDNEYNEDPLIPPQVQAPASGSSGDELKELRPKRSRSASESGGGRSDPRKARTADSSRAAPRSERDREEREVEDDMDADFTDFSFDVLPDLPELPGFHLCWLSTTNGQDTIERRMQMGYTPVLAEELDEVLVTQGGAKRFHRITGRHGEQENIVSCNEMLLFKIPLGRYRRIMQHYHDDRPLEDEAAIRHGIEQMAEDAADRRGSVSVAEGTNELGRRKGRPVW